MSKIIIIFFLLTLNFFPVNISYSQISPVWQVSFNDSITETNYSVKSKLDSKGNIVVLAEGTNNSLEGEDYVIVKYNADGNEVMEQTLQWNG